MFYFKVGSSFLIGLEIYWQNQLDIYETSQNFYTGIYRCYIIPCKEGMFAIVCLVIDQRGETED